MELGLFQSALVGSFGYLHNGGTWFISCIFVCYLFYPNVVHLISKNSFENNFALLSVLYCASSYAFLSVYKLQFASIYANPLSYLILVLSITIVCEVLLRFMDMVFFHRFFNRGRYLFKCHVELHLV